MHRLQERGPVAALSPSRRLALGAATAGAVVVADQVAKTWALRALDDGPHHVVWTLRFNLSFNSGAAFGIGRGLAPILVVVGVGLVVALVGAGRSASTGPAVASLGLVVGGAVGNLADRVLRDHGGAVVDFIDLQWWPVFNLADMAITCGAVLLVLTASRADRAVARGVNAGGRPEHA